MICILKHAFMASQPLVPGSTWGASHAVPGELVGWIIGTDVPDAWRQAHAAGEHELAAALYRSEFLAPGKHQITAQHTALVS